ncbi:MAG TPA: hypothetical protein VK653_15330 [Xanthobacteraceae bacterium]|jgi:hypothetical protein|nr:hypothetical protein [Xanthobacteraceae bacterium]
MSDSLAAKTNAAPVSSSTRNGASDLRMLAEVEKWMATIREINREQQGAPKTSAMN